MDFAMDFAMDCEALAREAVIYTLPLYEMTRMQSASSPRRNAARAGAEQAADPGGGPESTWRWVNLFSHTRHLLGPADRRVVTPNNDTLYTGWRNFEMGYASESVNLTCELTTRVQETELGHGVCKQNGT